MSDIPTDKLESLVAGTDYDMEWAEEQYQEQAQRADNAGLDLDDDQLVSIVSGQMQKVKRVQTGGEFMEVAILGFGHGGHRSWKSGDLVIGYGVVHPEEGEDGIAAIQFKDEHIPTDDTMEYFDPSGDALPTLRAYISLEEADEFSDRRQTYYIGQTTDESKLSLVDPLEVDEDDLCAPLPSEKDNQKKLLHNEAFFPEQATLAEIVDHLSEEFTYYDDDGEEQSSFVNILNLDIKRFRGQVQDVARRLPHECEGDENPYGRVTLTDDSLSVEEIEESPVTDEDDRTVGLDVWLPPQLVTFGEDSIVEVYGSISSNEGHITMNGVGILPEIAFPYEEDGEEYESDSEAI